MPRPRIDQINVIVSDVEAAARFLTGLGVDVPDTMHEWRAHHREVPTTTSASEDDDVHEEPFEIDLDSNAFAQRWGGLAPSFTGVVVNLRVEEREDVDELHERAVSLHGRSLKDPYDAFWGSRFAVVEGPGPLVVGIMSVPDAARRVAPPDPATFV